MNILESLNWRYASKKMNGSKVPSESIEKILEAARLAPTSNGLQPFEIFSISNQELKENIKEISWNQSVVSECSHLLVFAAWDTYTAERINMMFDLSVKIRGVKTEGGEAWRKSLIERYPPRDPQINFEHAARQAYLAFGIAVATTALEKLDSTPMEGFDSVSLDKILGLESKGLKSVVMLAVGHRDQEGDWNAKLKKVRKTRNQLVTDIS